MARRLPPQKRAYYDFETWNCTCEQDSPKSLVYLWYARVGGVDYWGYSGASFLNLVNQQTEKVTWWAYNFKGYEANYLKPLLLYNDRHFEYVIEEELEGYKKKNMWSDLTGDEGNNNISIAFKNQNGKLQTFLCAMKMVNPRGGLSKWGEVFKIPKGKDTPIYYCHPPETPPLKRYYVVGRIFHQPITREKEAKKWRDYVRRDVDILEKIVETNLEILGYDEHSYRPSLASYAYWWWLKHAPFNIKKLIYNQIRDVNMLEKIRTAFRGGYNFVSEKFQNKAVNYYGMDRKSAYPTELVVRPFPIGPPIKCDEWNCKHPLHIASISYYEFRLKPRKLPIFKKTNAGVDDYLSEGAVIVWTAIGQEHCFIRENYFFARSEINWKYCFQAMSGRLFEHYFRHFFVLKETSKGVEKEVAKIYNNSLWGALAQRAVKNKKVFRKVNNISNLHKGKVAYPSQQGGWYVEQTLDKEGDIDRWFESKKARYLPIGVFTTAYQRLEMVRVGQLNYDRLLMMDTDSCFIVGSEADFKVPRSVGGVPDWARNYRLGEWDPVIFREGKVMKVLGPKCYSVFDERGGLVEIKTAGLGSAPEIRKIIKKKVTLETFELGLSIPYGATKSRKLKGSGVGITHSVHEIKKKRKSSVF